VYSFTENAGAEKTVSEAVKIRQENMNAEH